MIVVAFSIVVFALALPKIALRRPGYYGSYTTTSTPVYYEAGSGSGSINVSLGNASVENNPNDEFITLSNNGINPIDITGYTISNDVNSAVVPKGFKIFLGSPSTDIILNPGDRAIVVSGSSASVNEQPLPSFKENICTPYLKSQYQFPAGLNANCPLPSNEPGLNNLDNDCRDFVQTLPNCQVPKLSPYNDEGISTACRAFITTHYSYQGCLTNHQNDANFNGSTWYVYLYRPFEMWPARYGSVKIYDSEGHIIYSQKY